MAECDSNEGSGYRSKQEKNIVRTPRRRIPVVFAQKEADRPQGYMETETREPERQTSPAKIEVENPTDIAEDTTVVAEDTMISTSGLRRLALEKLPKESVLREVILSEKEELTPEEFIAKMEVWLVLLNHEN